ncbi:MAG: ribosome maturation factor RimM [Muribaculaceae bacterium]|nr:ribosome maturation factor RimM [Muribaculaceae bacterium]
MISRSHLTRIGSLVKPHGIKGEISALFDVGIFPEDGIETVFVELDGLMVPFRIEAVRERGAESRLLTLKGIRSQEDAARVTGRDICVEKALLDDGDSEDDGQVYLDDLIGYAVEVEDAAASVQRIGVIEDFDDSTPNLLFHVSAPGNGTLLIPAVADFIENIDHDSRVVLMSLPEGLLSL